MRDSVKGDFGPDGITFPLEAGIDVARPLFQDFGTVIIGPRR